MMLWRRLLGLLGLSAPDTTGDEPRLRELEERTQRLTERQAYRDNVLRMLRAQAELTRGGKDRD